MFLQIGIISNRKGILVKQALSGPSCQGPSNYGTILLIDPWAKATLPVFSTICEPQCCFFTSTLNWITSMNDIPAKYKKFMHSPKDHDMVFTQMSTIKSPRILLIYYVKTMYLPISTAKSPRMVPEADSDGLVAPIILWPVVTMFFPSHIIATTGPEMICSTRLLKKGLEVGRQICIMPLSKSTINIHKIHP